MLRNFFSTIGVFLLEDSLIRVKFAIETSIGEFYLIFALIGIAFDSEGFQLWFL